jgi:hypothetical protein
MLVLLLICCYLFVTTVSFGLLTMRLAGKLWHDKGASPLFSADILSIIGLVTIGTLLNYYSLFFKTGGLVPHGIVLAVVITTLVSFRSDWKNLMGIGGNRKKIIENGLLALPVIISILFYAVQYSRLDDTGLYHAQSIQWIEKYRCVPGLGNLHFRLAFNSSFFVLSAFYGFSFLLGQTCYSLNPYLCVLFAVSVLVHLRKSMVSGNHRLLFILLFLFVAYYSVFEVYVSSPSPDLIAAIMLFYIFLLVIREERSFFSTGTLLAMALVTSFLLTIKLSQMPVLFFLGYFFLNKELRLSQRILLPLLAPAVVLLPWLIRNVVLSGYLAYPLPGLDLFSFDWKIPAASVTAVKNWIRSWAIMPGQTPENVFRLSPGEWLPVWFHRLPGFYRFSLAVCFLSPVIVAAARIRKKDKLGRELVTFWSVCFAGLVFWFATAPDIRFAYGFILFCVAIPLAAFTGLLGRVRPKTLTGGVLAFVVLFGLVHAISPQLRTSPEKLVEHLWRPEPLKEARTVEKKARNLTVSVPAVGNMCYNAAIPCTPYFNPDLELRGTRLDDGFRIAAR